MKPKNLVFLIPSLTAGGAERVLSTIANELVKYYDVKIIQLYKSVPFYSLSNQIKLDYCREIYLPNFSVLKSLLNHIFMIRKIYNLLKKDTDIVIGFTTTSNIYSVIISKLLRKPCIISERSHPKYNVNKTWNYLIKTIYPKANKIVVQTQGIKKYFTEFINNNKLVVINNPVSPKLTEHYNLNAKKENIILHVGRYSKEKNQNLLIKAFANISHKDWQLVLIGEGDQKQKYKILINELNLQKRIHLKENTPNIFNEYNKAKIFTLTSNYEGFPNALIEAMYFGLPCISTNCDFGPSEIIDDNKNGILINANNQNELEERLLDLMRSEKLRTRLSENALKTAKDFDIKTITKKWYKLIEELAN